MSYWSLPGTYPYSLLTYTFTLYLENNDIETVVGFEDTCRFYADKLFFELKSPDAEQRGQAGAEQKNCPGFGNCRSR